MPYFDHEEYLEYQRNYAKAHPRSREYWRKVNANRTPDRVARNIYQKEYRRKQRIRNFIACDGEGYTIPGTNMMTDLFGMNGTGYNIRQEYGILRIGQEILYTGKPLTSKDCLEFIVSRNPSAGIYVGYYFDYDCTMILRDLPEHIVARILSGKYTAYDKYVIKYIPRQFLSVGLLNKQGRTIKGSSVVINEVGSFFQCKFTNALTLWSAAPDDIIDRIQVGKDKRGTETCVDNEMIEYNALECDYLSELMDSFSAVIEEIDIVPVKWRGPGWIAASALKKYKVIKRVDVEKLLPDEFRTIAPLAYYGGRFETPMVGDIGAVYAYDLNSAYPAAMQYLPCLEHCKIVKFDRDEIITPHSLAFIEFDHPDDGQRLCGIPIRSDKGILYWPRRGSGWYWGIEILAARAAGMSFKVIRGWHVASECGHNPFEFVKDLYEQRKRVGKNAKGVALKLSYNSVYGKMVQRIGTRPYYNPIWAGLITAYVRSWLIDGYRDWQDDIAMIATDALYSRKPLALNIGSELGQWSEEKTDNLFIVQPGIYEAEGRAVKTRGVEKGILSAAMPEFRMKWSKYMQSKEGALPSNQVMVHAFLGLKLAHAQNKPWQAGSWNDNIRNIAFDWTGKRHFEPQFVRNDYVMTWPKLGDTSVQSKINDGTILDTRAELDILVHEQPDHVTIL